MDESDYAEFVKNEFKCQEQEYFGVDEKEQ